jgi:hypothetical protein
MKQLVVLSSYPICPHTQANWTLSTKSLTIFTQLLQMNGEIDISIIEVGVLVPRMLTNVPV